MADYRIYTAGDIESGFDAAEAKKSFAQLFKITEEEAAAYLDRGKSIQKNISKEQAEKFQGKLLKIGITAIVEEIADPTGGLSLLPVDDATTDQKTSHTDQLPEPPSQQPENTQAAFVSCYECNKVQQRAQSCTDCGAALIQSKRPDKKPVAAARKSKVHSRATVNDKFDKSGVSVKALLIPVCAAILGAFLWKFIAISTEREFGLVAWLLGGVVGFASVAVGFKGHNAGLACAALTVFAIFGGKYLVVSDYMTQAEQLFSSDGAGAAIQEMISYAEEERAAFARIDADDDLEVKNFMVKYGYSNARTGLLVSDSNLEDFRYSEQQWLQADVAGSYPDNFDLSNTGEYSDQGMPELAAAFSDISKVGLVFDSLDLLDLLFAFFGVSTAYQLGRSGI